MPLTAGAAHGNQLSSVAELNCPPGGHAHDDGGPYHDTPTTLTDFHTRLKFFADPTLFGIKRPPAGTPPVSPSRARALLDELFATFSDPILAVLDLMVGCPPVTLDDAARQLGMTHERVRRLYQEGTFGFKNWLLDRRFAELHVSFTEFRDRIGVAFPDRRRLVERPSTAVFGPGLGPRQLNRVLYWSGYRRWNGWICHSGHDIVDDLGRAADRDGYATAGAISEIVRGVHPEFSEQLITDAVSSTRALAMLPSGGGVIVWARATVAHQCYALLAATNDRLTIDDLAVRLDRKPASIAKAVRADRRLIKQPDKRYAAIANWPPPATEPVSATAGARPERVDSAPIGARLSRG